MTVQFIVRLIKKRDTQTFLKKIAVFSLMLLLIAPVVQTSAKKESGQIMWKTYPYSPPGSPISFPVDEGAHDTQDYPVEWWYVNFHLTGKKTGKQYGVFVGFFKFTLPDSSDKQLRMFSISDISEEKIHNNVAVGKLNASQTHLELTFQVDTLFTDFSAQSLKEQTTINTDLMAQGEITQEKNLDFSEEPAIAPMTTGDDDGIGDDMTEGEQESYSDRWYTKRNTKGLLPFQYRLDVQGNSQQGDQPMRLAVDMDCVKRPLLVGGNGFLEFGSYGSSYYYSLTQLTVVGIITLNDITEEITGDAWIDHQWGTFVNENRPPFGLTFTYEWFSMKLDDYQIVVCDAWDRISEEKISESLIGGLNLINSAGASEVLQEYTIEALRFWNSSSNRNYAAGWQITEPTRSIDILVTPVYNEQMISLLDQEPLQAILEYFFPAASFWEGVCSVSGWIGDTAVQGSAFVELTHYYKNHDDGQMMLPNAV